MSAGTPVIARSVSITVTVKVWLTVVGVSSASLAVQVTVVVPIGNVEPEAGAQPTVATVTSPASSRGVGAAYATTAPLGLVALVVMLAGNPARPRSLSAGDPNSQVSL